MTTSLHDLALPAPLALAVVLAVIAIAIYSVRVFGRQQRRRVRRNARALSRTFARFIAGQVTVPELKRAAAYSDSATFWAALEMFSLRLSRPEWRRLSMALTRNRHSRAERAALTDESPWRRELAARRLGLLYASASRRALRRALSRGPEIVTHAAARSLARFRDAAALRWLLRHPGSVGRRPRESLVALLQAFGRRALPDLSAALERGVDSARFEIALIKTLGHGRYRGAWTALERYLQDGTLDQRAAAARAIGQLRAVEAATSLLGALKDEAWQVRAQAARALGKVSAPIAVPGLTARLSDPSWWVRRHAAYALVELGEDGRAALRGVVASSADTYARDMAREALDGGLTARSA